MDNRHDEDGKPYLAYYRNDLTLGFVWSGFFRDEVQVTREMGEPIIATFGITGLPPAMSPTDLLKSFREACEAWAEENTTTELFGIPIRRSIIITAKEELDEPLDVARKLELIEKSGWPLAWDHCHKIYFLQDEGREQQAREIGYEIHPSTELREIWESSCGLRFVSRWGYDNDDFNHPWNIQQFEED